jgi:hypothetical protein
MPEDLLAAMLAMISAIWASALLSAATYSAVVVELGVTCNFGGEQDHASAVRIEALQIDFNDQIGVCGNGS